MKKLFRYAVLTREKNYPLSILCRNKKEAMREKRRHKEAVIEAI